MKEQKLELKVDLTEFERKVKEITEKNNSKLIPYRIIAILKEDTWNITAMDKTLGILRMKICAKTGEEILFQKGSLMDFMGFKRP